MPAVLAASSMFRCESSAAMASSFLRPNFSPWPTICHHLTPSAPAQQLVVSHCTSKLQVGPMTSVWMVGSFLYHSSKIQTLCDQGGEGRSEHTKGFCLPCAALCVAQVWSQAIALHHDFGARIAPRF